MVIYEVNVVIGRELRDKFLQWIPDHIEQMLEFDGFLSAQLTELDRRQSAEFLNLQDDEDAWVIHYQVANQAHLETYFREHASSMRQDAPRLFGARFRAERRVLHAHLLQS